MTQRSKNVILGLLAAGAIGFAVFGWPGLWVYGTTTTEMYRVNRFTATKEWATDSGWMTLEQQNAIWHAKREKEVAAIARTIEEKSKTVAYAVRSSESLKVGFAGEQPVLFYDGHEISQIESALQKADVPVQ